LYVAAGVFHPGRHWTSPFLAWGLRQPGVVPPGGSVLDLGTGSGLAALVAAEAGAGRVVATDLSPAAVRCAAVNIAQAGLADRVVVRQGDLFAPVTGERFDLIISNPPYLRGVPLTLAEHAYLGGSHYEWLDRFAAEAADYLTPRGRVLVVLGDAADVPTILAHLRAPGWHVRPVAHQDIWVEVLYLFVMTRLTGDFT
jgi:release factor glutamine methyltransferase